MVARVLACKSVEDEFCGICHKEGSLPAVVGWAVVLTQNDPGDAAGVVDSKRSTDQ
jgi:hypothetical protein